MQIQIIVRFGIVNSINTHLRLNTLHIKPNMSPEACSGFYSSGSDLFMGGFKESRKLSLGLQKNA